MTPALTERLRAAGAAGVELASLDRDDRIAVERATRGGLLVQVARIVGRASVPVAILAELAAAVGADALAVATAAAKAKGKSASKDPLDRYYTPPGLARVLVGAVADLYPGPPPARVIEPSVGGGAWLPAIRSEWPAAHILAVDLDPAATGLASADAGIAADLLSIPVEVVREAGGIDLAIGNPPFSHAIRHTHHLLQLVRPGGLVALLLPATVGHLAGWLSLPLPEREVPVQGRPAFASPALSTESSGNGKTEYSLFIWRAGADPATTLRSRAVAWSRPRQPRPRSVRARRAGGGR